MSCQELKFSTESKTILLYWGPWGEKWKLLGIFKTSRSAKITIWSWEGCPQVTPFNSGVICVWHPEMLKILFGVGRGLPWGFFLCAKYCKFLRTLGIQILNSQYSVWRPTSQIKILKWKLSETCRNVNLPWGRELRTSHPVGFQLRIWSFDLNTL